MLYLDTPEVEYFDEASQEFRKVPPQHLQLEHSLLSISKWESRWRVPFLDTSRKKTTAQYLDYVYCMTVNSKAVDKRIFALMPEECLNKISNFIDTPQTATVVNRSQLSEQDAPNGKRQVMTSELIYWQMITFNIPFTCEKWHLDRLLALIEISDVKAKSANRGGKKKKRLSNSAIAKRAALNNARKAKLGIKD